MTNTDKYMLRVDMEDFEKGSAYAQYTLFYIDSESSYYRLHIGSYVNGGAGEQISKHHFCHWIYTHQYSNFRHDHWFQREIFMDTIMNEDKVSL